MDKKCLFVFLLKPVHVMDQISTRNSRKICTCRIYAHVKGFGFLGGGGAFYFSVNFFQNPVSTVSVWFENKLQFCMDFFNVHFETNDQQIFLK